MPDPNEYLRRLCSTADLLTNDPDGIYEGSGLKPHVDNTVDLHRRLHDGRRSDRQRR